MTHVPPRPHVVPVGGGEEGRERRCGVKEENEGREGKKGRKGREKGNGNGG